MLQQAFFDKVLNKKTFLKRLEIFSIYVFIIPVDSLFVKWKF